MTGGEKRKKKKDSRVIKSTRCKNGRCLELNEGMKKMILVNHVYP